MMTVDVSLNKLIGQLDVLSEVIQELSSKIDSTISTLSTKINMACSVEVVESDNSDWLSTISENLFKELRSGKLLKKFNGAETVLAGGLIEGKDFLSKLIDSIALVKGGAGTLGESLAVVFGKGGGIATIVAGALLGLSSFIDMLKNGFDWINEIMMIIGVAVAAVGAVIVGASAGVAALVAAVVAGVATVVILVKDNWDIICEWFSNLGEWFNENVIFPVVSFFDGLFQRVSQIFEGLCITIQAVWILVSTWFNDNVITPITSLFESIWTNVSGFFDGLWQDIKTIWQNVATWFDKNVTQPIQGFFGAMWDGIKQGMISTMNAVIGGIESGINFIIAGINSIINGFNRIVSWAARVAEVEWGGVSEIEYVQLTRIQTFETGGYPERASLFWANENGVPEFVGRIGSNTAVASGTEITGIADAVYSTGQAETSLLTTAVNLLQEIARKDMSVNIGDREIARANYRGQKSLGSKLIIEY